MKYTIDRVILFAKTAKQLLSKGAGAGRNATKEGSGFNLGGLPAWARGLIDAIDFDLSCVTWKC